MSNINKLDARTSSPKPLATDDNLFTTEASNSVSTKSSQEAEQNRHNSWNIWERGKLALAFASGGAFLGGQIANLPGGIAGALIGAIFGWFAKADVASHSKTSE